MSGQYVDIVEQIAEQVREATERSAQIAVPAIDGWNANFRAAQLEAQGSLALGHLNDLMSQTASAYDPQIRINDRDDLSAMPAELQGLLEAQLLAQLATVPTFVRRYSAGNDNNSVGELISASLRVNTDMQRWVIGERGWRENLLAAQLRKQGNTTATQGSSTADWKATDQLQHRKREFLGWSRWQRIGDRTSKASASEFASRYAGVPNYYNLAGAPGDQALRIAALATKRQTSVATANLLGMTENTQPLAVAALARVEFRRPSGSAFAVLARNRREYANLFNPFWEARLAALDDGVTN